MQALHTQAAGQSLPLQVHALCELHGPLAVLQRPRANRVLHLSALVPRGALYAVHIQAGRASWVARPRTYLCSWPLSGALPLVGAWGRHPPLRTAVETPLETAPGAGSVPTGLLQGALPDLRALPSAKTGWHLGVPWSAPWAPTGATPPNRLWPLPAQPPVGAGWAADPACSSVVPSGPAAARAAADPSLPPRSFESYGLLWRSAEWQLPSVEDWCWLLGLPADWVAPLRKHHLATLACAPPQAVLRTLLQPLATFHPAPPLPQAGGTGERLGPLRPLFEAHAHLFAGPSHPLNRFSASLARRGLSPAAFGAPCYPELEARGLAAAGIGTQRGATISRWAPPPLIQASAPDDHVRQALQLEHPFQRPPMLELDLEFAVELSAGKEASLARSAFGELIAKLKTSFADFDRQAQALMPAPVHRVHGGHSVGLLLFWVLLLGWPDLDLILREVIGYSIVGAVAPSFLYPTVAPPPANTVEDLLRSAEEWNAHLEATLGPASESGTDEEILRQTRKDRALGAAAGPFLSSQLDRAFGRGRWRAVPRHGLWQEHNGKLRCIDNARSSEHNAATSETERLRVIAGDIVPAVARKFHSLLAQSKPSGKAEQEPDSLVGSSEDWERGYRQRACTQDHLRFNVVAFWHCGLKKVLFWVYFGLLFGLASSVVAFNRTPALLVAVLRRVAGVPAFHYFDDLGLVDRASLGKVGQNLLQLVHTSAGFALDGGKAQERETSWVFLGVLYKLREALSKGLIVADAKPGRRAQILARLNTILAAREASLREIQSLRGKGGFLSQTTFGRMGRAAESAMVRFEVEAAREAGPRLHRPATDDLLHALQLLKALILRAPARSLYLQPRYRAPTVLYTDAMFVQPGSPQGLSDLLAEPRKATVYAPAADANPPPVGDATCRVGVVVFSERLRRPLGLTAVVTKELLAALLVRKQQITQAETLVAALVLQEVPHALQDVDALWFIDNQGAEAGLISGYSGALDSAAMLGVTHICLAALNCRVWWEYVASELNPSDGLSRAGLKDPWTLQQGWDLRECQLPDWSNLRDLPLDTLLCKFAENVARLPEANLREAPVDWQLPEVIPEQLASALELETALLGRHNAAAEALSVQILAERGGGAIPGRPLSTNPPPTMVLPRGAGAPEPGVPEEGAPPSRGGRGRKRPG